MTEQEMIQLAKTVQPRTFLAPGEPFKVRLECGLEFDAVSLSFKQERAITEYEDEVQRSDARGAGVPWDQAKASLALAMPHKNPEQIDQIVDSLNIGLVQELFRKIMHQQRVSEDDAKKSEPPH